MSEPVAPNSRGKPTPADIQRYWEGTIKPSQRSIEQKMRTDGYEVSASTIIRAVRGGFGPNRGQDKKPPTPRQTSPEINAVNQVNALAGAAPAGAEVANALLQAIQNLPDGAKERVKSLLEMDEQDLENQTNKLVKVARYLLAEDLAQHTKLMMLAPDKAARLYQALGSGLVSTPLPPTPPSDGAKVIDHNANEPRRLSPSAQAIADFRQKRGSAAA